ncbi:MAG: NAD(P)-dependent oxidoreductase [Thermoleophilia bacterium]|nr:NAD(P)-dependent oxidoreductase [Thermoleophilia bacterium]GIK77892.1 MAG: dTDP-glucose 4,6-dehydratase [Actinomycetes bacterium]
MRVFIAGATGAIGRELVPLLARRGHEVTAMSRHGAAAAAAADRVDSVAADGLDREAVARAVAATEPEVVVHQMTALGGDLDLRRFERTFARTNRLRTEGTDNLIAAARDGGARRIVAQSFAGWPYAREGGPVKTEEDPLDPDPPRAVRATVDAIRYLERAVTGAEGLEGIALRYGGFYGSGTSLGPSGEQTELIRGRRFPIVGDGGGIWSLIHIHDAASATAAAIEGGDPGIYNVVDDDPAPVREWLPYLARVLGAKPPRHLPAWVGRLTAGEHGVILMTAIRGASNAKAKRELDWVLRYPSWRQGFKELAIGADRRR